VMAGGSSAITSSWLTSTPVRAFCKQDIAPERLSACLGQDEAVRILRDGSGTQWDPDVVATFFRLVRETPPHRQAA